MSSNIFRFLRCVEPAHEAVIYLDLLILPTVRADLFVMNNNLIDQRVQYLSVKIIEICVFANDIYRRHLSAL